ncbi:hypothetical protein K488DRAFT_56112 [Vararia minispora EC-137]|uniref:Uncharacterized protein n=1 Tax=Vararia minispora EC-137 TaxID=1314806 RepID=A0ACB8QD91_9AGAM|nr:hypothetical protein K488DRAFT_56112 [Vararia minispora EC-137]
MSTPERRREIAQDTLYRTPSIISSTPGASDTSIFISPSRDTYNDPLRYRNPLAPLERTRCPTFPPTTVRVDGRDAFTCARDVMQDGHEKVVVLNLASDERRAGGWLEYLTRTQEEALCYSSTLYTTLKEEYYPWPNLGPGASAGIFSPAVVVFKHDLDHDCADLPVEQRRVVSVITVAAPRHPQLTPDGSSLGREEDIEDFRAKIRLIYRIAGREKRQALILGACPMGCGAYACPPEQVASEMRAILLEDEFRGWFSAVVFAVYRSETHPSPVYDVFKRFLDGTVV